MQGQVISDHPSVLHHEPNSLQLANVCDRIPRYGDEVGKFSGLDSAQAILPTQQFCGICRDPTNDVERRHSALTYRGKHVWRWLGRAFCQGRTSTCLIRGQTSLPTSVPAEPERCIVAG